jgi:hypothetical protein
LLLFALTAVPAGAAEPTPADRQWIARCMAQFAGEKREPRAVRTYCTCMHEMFEDNAPVTQTKMERMYPPVHRSCQIEAGRK